ncbi:MAG: succinate--CoA ligase subunit beta, partial [Bacteroidetes bacterium]|nr:succinate--CoA ligase subunit beta [Bacteroidota bacterium]
MNLHEYQAKELLKRYNVPVQEGIPVDSAGAAEEAYKNLKVQFGNSFAVVKAQIHAGGRGKGKIKGTEQRGVVVGKNAEDIKQIASTLLGGTLVTVQTGAAGKIVNKVLVAQDVYYPGPNPTKEF